jgi:hypothetical protein
VSPPAPPPRRPRWRTPTLLSSATRFKPRSETKSCLKP